MISESKKQEILAAFGAYLGRDNAERMASYSLAELLDVEAMLGDWDRNARYRIAIRDRITELESRSDEKQGDSSVWIKAIGYIIASSLVVGVLKQVGSYLLDLF